MAKRKPYSKREKNYFLSLKRQLEFRMYGASPSATFRQFCRMMVEILDIIIDENYGGNDGIGEYE